MRSLEECLILELFINVAEGVGSVPPPSYKYRDTRRETMVKKQISIPVNNFNFSGFDFNDPHYFRVERYPLYGGRAETMIKEAMLNLMLSQEQDVRAEAYNLLARLTTPKFYKFLLEQSEFSINGAINIIAKAHRETWKVF